MVWKLSRSQCRAAPPVRQPLPPACPQSSGGGWRWVVAPVLHSSSQFETATERPPAWTKSTRPATIVVVETLPQNRKQRMGLTIHYSLSLPAKTTVPDVKQQLGTLRQHCLDLPFQEVGELLEFRGETNAILIFGIGKTRCAGFSVRRIRPSISNTTGRASQCRFRAGRMEVTVGRFCRSISSGSARIPGTVARKRTLG